MEYDADAAFKEIVKDAENSQVNTIATMLAELKKEMESLKPTIEQANNQKKLIDRDIQSHKDAIQELAESKHSIDNAIWETQKRMRTIERELNAQQQRLTQAIENKQLAEQYQKMAEEFDRLTAGLPWREWAFPHQIEGAKKLAAQQRAILADTMGLGKSLTALIYLDMIQAKKVLMVVPNDTTQNMVREIKHWAPHRNVIDASGMPKAQRDFLLTTLGMMDQFILVVNYEINRRDKDFNNHVLDMQIDTIICDESHNVKNQKTAAFKMVKEITQEPNCCSACGSKNLKQTSSY